MPPATPSAPPPPVIYLPESLLDCQDPAELGPAETSADALIKYEAARAGERRCRENLRAIRDLYRKQSR